jgi:hypothetical protein
MPGCWARIVGSRAPGAILKTTIFHPESYIRVKYMLNLGVFHEEAQLHTGRGHKATR